MTTQSIPSGYMQDPLGRLVPESMVKDIDKLRDQTVRQIVGQALKVNEALVKFKTTTFSDLEAFVDTSAEQYGVKLGGKKGNLVLHSFDGRFRVIQQVQENIKFDERLKVAKALIDECIVAWSEGSSDEIKVIVNDAFRTDKEGDISTARVLGLRRLNIKDEKWKRAMSAIGDALSVVGSRAYVRVYERVGDTDQYRAISLDLASA
ncbi:DUF3164 family protein [Roseateles chitinivorans]|uniref:DUF3164 family protein n=1 Tax=Roseateles chitinivorans TaxID=2917965 RepID=UPI003D678938